MKKLMMAILGLTVLGISHCLASELGPFRYRLQPASNWKESYFPVRANYDLNWCGSSLVVTLGVGGGPEFRTLDVSSGAIDKIAVGWGHGRGYCSPDGKYLFTIKNSKPFQIGLVDLSKKDFSILETDTSGRSGFPFPVDNLVSPDGRFLMSIDQRATPFSANAKLTLLPVLSAEALQRTYYSRVIWGRDGSVLYQFGSGFVDVLNTKTRKIVREKLTLDGHNTVNAAKYSPQNEKLYVLGYPDNGVGGSNLYAVSFSGDALIPKLLLEDVQGFDVDREGNIFFIKSVGKTFQSESDTEYTKDAFDGLFYWREGEEIDLIRKYSPGTIYTPVLSKNGDQLVFKRSRDLRSHDSGIAVLIKRTP